MMEMRNCSVYRCGTIGIAVGIAFLAGGGPPIAASLAFDVKPPLCSNRAVSLSAMAYCPSDPVPHSGDHFHLASTVNAEFAIAIRQIPRASIGEPGKFCELFAWERWRTCE
jgi:hypothetical protein